MKRLRAACPLLLAAAVACPAFPAPSPEGLLAIALKGPAVPFEGQQVSTVTMDAGPVRTEVSVFGDGKGRVRREYRKGPAAGVVVFQSGPVVWQRQGDGAWLRLPSAPPPDAATAAARIVSNYTVTAGRPVTLAGRRAVPLKIQARRAYNPSRRIWVDRFTGIILKDELLAPDGRLRSSTVFTSLRLRPQSKNLFTAPATSTKPALFGPSSFQRHASAAEVERASGRPVLLPGHVPAGYRIETYGVMSTRNGWTMPAVRYSDGLSAFTIFQRGPGAGPGGPGRGAGGGMGRGRGMGRGPGGGAGRGRGGMGGGGGQAGDGLHGLRSDRQRSVAIASTERTNYLLVGDLAEDELRRVANSLP